MKKNILLYIALLLWFVVPAEAQLTIFGADMEAKNGAEVHMDFRVVDFDSIVSMQFSLNWDSTVLAFRSVTATDSLPGLKSTPSPANFINSKPGQLRSLWISNSGEGLNLTDSTVLFTISFEVIGQPDSVSSVALSDTPIAIEFIARQNGENKTVELNYTNGSVKVENMSTSSLALAAPVATLYQNEPNPFSRLTLVKFELEQSAALNFQIFDLQGRLIYSRQDRFEAGPQQIALRADQFPASGTYLYRLQGGQRGTATKKLTVIK